jgi:putative toxin-antitoxin system antitoxin component (TIGR02293 family)
MGMNALTQAAATKRRSNPKPLNFLELHDAEPMERVEMVRAGLRSTLPAEIAARMGVSRERVYAMLGLPRATVERKVREGKPLATSEGSRVLGLARLIGLVERIVLESGNPEGFDAAVWLGDWLDRKVPALGGRRPGDLLDTDEGRDLVARLLLSVQSGAYW